MEQVKVVAKKIKALEIQGATNVAMNAIAAVGDFSKRNPKKSIDKAADLLLSTRPTEPLMINVLNQLKETKIDDVPRKSKELLKHIEESMEKIVEIGANLVKDGMTIQTICHSSTVINILKRAKEQNKKIKVVNTETRPMFQGRKTAKELHELGIEVTHYVDSGILKAMKDEKVDICLIGLDAIFMDGSVANKIGSGLLALAAETMKIPLYACGHGLKFDKKSLFAGYVKIEQRDTKEIWDYEVTIKNPAFEIVPDEQISGIITEFGILPPAVAGFKISEELEKL